MKSRNAAPRLLLATACATFILAACSASPESQLKSAEKALHAGDYGTVLVNTRNVLSKDKTNGAAQLLLVRTLVQLGDLDSAEQQLEAGKAMKLPAAEVAEIKARIALERGKAADLLADIEAGKSGLDGAKKDYFQARALQATRRVIEALTLYTQLLANSPKDDELHVLSAECQIFLGRPQLAKEQVELALAAKPQSAKAWLLKSALQAGDGEAEPSRQSLDKAAEFAPGQLTLREHASMLGALVDSGLARGDLGAASKSQAGLVKAAPQALFTELAAARVQLAKGEVDASVTALQTLLQKANDYVQVRVSLVAALLLKGNYELALHELGTLRGANLDDPRFKLVEAAVKAAAGEKDATPGRAIALANALSGLNHGYLAMPLIDAALKQTPDSVPLASAQVRLMLAAGRTKDALEKAEGLAKQNDKDLQVLAVLVDSQVANGKWADATATTEKVYAQKPLAQVAMSLSQLRTRGKLAEPGEPLQRWLAKNPKDIEVRTRLAMLDESQGNKAEAIANYEQAIADAPRNYIALNNLAVLYREKGDARALATAKRAYDLAPKQAAVVDTYAWLLLQGNEAAKALPLLRSAVEAMPANAEVRYHYAEALARTGNKADAKTQITEALRDPTPMPWHADAKKFAATL